MVPRHSANASAPLQASVTSMGTGGMPTTTAAAVLWAWVIGNRTWVANQGSRSSPKRPRLHATARRANLAATVRPGAMSVCARNLLQRDMLRAEGSAQLFDRFEGSQPRRAGKD